MERKPSKQNTQYSTNALLFSLLIHAYSSLQQEKHLVQFICKCRHTNRSNLLKLFVVDQAFSFLCMCIVVPSEVSGD